ncbi:hypothetical protein TVAG_113300 [Trichomonas vaginalis G3]|uniref:Leucine Rich Repeat family protein n=1 Tax=Trichomonas vaginalis (strain ATCC PRA-98 / G3) TaxID=412133 RepID=A2DNI3_TRIV3|nr:ribonuclease inhibitor domain-containing protein [Trichomonas vaginalis G3]EAY17986.1 hypothetical protein TVAG_113300 [Trichomonas vaginalis G3]KAI5499070.1 ribonuclease inhibitor domain-containing protein [Trichomonas vaginalis G3]|eukprot:XP_001578972.1 hypothetical protein [Trichomonas vaginalis G3]
MSLPLIKIDGSKSDIIKEAIWFKTETILVMISMQYDLENSKKYKDGFLLITNAAIYIFKSKFLAQPKLDKKIHPLLITKIKVNPQQIYFLVGEEIIEIKTPNTIEIFEAINTNMLEMSYGLPQMKFYDIRSTVKLPQTTVKSRPKGLLQARIVFFAHLYNIKSEIGGVLQYFDKFEQKQNPMLVIGQSFSPAGFASSVGTAIGWESSIDTVVFQANIHSSFANMLHALLENNKMIEKIAFTDYKADIFPKFPTAQIQKSNVKKWWFMRCKTQLMIDFAEFSKNLPPTIEELTISGNVISDEEFKKLEAKIETSPSLKNLNILNIIRNKMNPFPFDSFMNAIQVTSKLTTLTLRGMDSNASDLFTTICTSPNRIKVLNLTHMQFRSAIIETAVLPPSLISINVSFCAFLSASFKTLMHLFISQPRVVPFSLQMQCLVIKPISYGILETIDFSKAYSNISEVDWSGNTLPALESRFFFAFLFTQKRLQALKFDNITAEDSQNFLKNLVQLLASLRVSAIDLSGRFESTEILQFLESLSYMKWLRRISIKNSLAGDNGVKQMIKTISNLPNLNEINADGFNCEDITTLIELWQAINSKPTIVSSDYPSVDLKGMKLSANDLVNNDKQVIEIAKQRKRTTTFDHRVMFVLDQMNKVFETHLLTAEDVAENLSKISSPDIFRQTVEMVFADAVDKIDKEMGSSSKPSNIEE